VDFRDAPAEAAFRTRIRTWLADNNPRLSYGTDEYWAAMPAWHAALYDARYFGIGWPVEHGGVDLPPIYNVIVDEELASAGAPARPIVGYLAHGLLGHGSEELQGRYIPGLVSGRERWCQGFSEPDSGSDLASLRTSAVRDGDEFVISGHKIWTSFSDLADRCFLLARTDPDVPKHKGLSAFVVPMTVAGITQIPLRMANGGTRDFGEVLFDGVRVHRDDMIGAEGEGWSIAMTIVSAEREPHELGWAARYSATVNQLLGIARADPGRLDPEDRRSLAWAIVEADMLSRHVPRRISERADGIPGGPIGSVDKLLMADTEQTVGHAALAIGGAPHDGADPSLFHTYLYSRAASVLGGTNQIQRNLIARRVLALPSSD
jgi:alkylation response protein AidB-like acyl-CoA dehydrogenase